MPPVKKKKKKTAKKKSSQKSISKEKKINIILLSIIIISITVVIILHVSDIVAFFQSSKATNTQSETESVNTSKSEQSDESSAKTSPKESENTSPTKETKEPSTSQKQSSESSKESEKKSLAITIYFIKITEDEKITLVPIKRHIEKTPAILTKTLETLLSGPTNDEISQGLSHYIPKQAKLQSVSVVNGIANLDFNDSFQFNEYGTAGLLAQLYQVIYTCTEIANINAVRITINNQVQQYLGGEGSIDVSQPLTRKLLESH